MGSIGRSIREVHRGVHRESMAASQVTLLPRRPVNPDPKLIIRITRMTLITLITQNIHTGSHALTQAPTHTHTHTHAHLGLVRDALAAQKSDLLRVGLGEQKKGGGCVCAGMRVCACAHVCVCVLWWRQRRKYEIYDIYLEGKIEGERAFSYSFVRLCSFSFSFSSERERAKEREKEREKESERKRARERESWNTG